MQQRLFYCPDCDGAGGRTVGALMGNGRRYSGPDPYYTDELECLVCDGTGHVSRDRAQGEEEGLRPYTPSRRRWRLSLHHKGLPYRADRDPLIELAKGRVCALQTRSRRNAAYVIAKQQAMRPVALPEARA